MAATTSAQATQPAQPIQPSQPQPPHLQSRQRRGSLPSLGGTSWQGLRLLSYNLFLRPPGIQNWSGRGVGGDYKNARTQLFLRHLADYDVVVLQEAFEWGNSRPDRIRAAARKAGLIYSLIGPQPAWSGKQFLDGGVLVLSRYPLTEARSIRFSRSGGADAICSKGVIYSRVVVCPPAPHPELGPDQHYQQREVAFHLFATHLQAWGEEIQDSQLQELKAFVQARVDADPRPLPVLLAGDFNMDARAEPGQHLLRELRSLTAGLYQHRLADLPGSPRYKFSDTLFDTYGYHPITNGHAHSVIRVEPGACMGGHEEDSQKAIDYVFLMNPPPEAHSLLRSGPQSSGSESAAKPPPVLPSACEDWQRPLPVLLQACQARVEPFFLHPQALHPGPHGLPPPPPADSAASAEPSGSLSQQAEQKELERLDWWTRQCPCGCDCSSGGKTGCRGHAADTGADRKAPASAADPPKAGLQRNSNHSRPPSSPYPFSQLSDHYGVRLELRVAIPDSVLPQYAEQLRRMAGTAAASATADPKQPPQPQLLPQQQQTPLVQLLQKLYPGPQAVLAGSERGQRALRAKRRWRGLQAVVRPALWWRKQAMSGNSSVAGAALGALGKARQRRGSMLLLNLRRHIEARRPSVLWQLKHTALVLSAVLLALFVVVASYRLARTLV